MIPLLFQYVISQRVPARRMCTTMRPHGISTAFCRAWFELDDNLYCVHVYIVVGHAQDPLEGKMEHRFYSTRDLDCVFGEYWDLVCIHEVRPCICHVVACHPRKPVRVVLQQHISSTTDPGPIMENLNADNRVVHAVVEAVDVLTFSSWVLSVFLFRERK